MTSCAASTSATPTSALTPELTTMVFSPASSTVISASPVGAPSIRCTWRASTPSSRSAASRKSPPSSPRRAPTNVTSCPRRAAATAWLAPLPPAWRCGEPPSTVSPGAGSRRTPTTRSTLTGCRRRPALTDALGARRGHDEVPEGLDVERDADLRVGAAGGSGRGSRRRSCRSSTRRAVSTATKTSRVSRISGRMTAATATGSCTGGAGRPRLAQVGVAEELDQVDDHRRHGRPDVAMRATTSRRRGRCA